jgi:uncharacterized protein YbaP (TraB family)
MRTASLALVLALALAGETGAQAPPKAQPVPEARHFLWEVSSLTNRIYLYGTVHAGKPAFYPLPEVVEQAFADSKVLAVEADIMDQQAMQKSASTTLLTPPDSLDKHVPAPLYARFRKQLDRFAVPEPQVARYKPFMASTVVAFAEWAQLGYLPQYGVEVYLLTKARRTGKKVVELEGAEVQTALIDSLTEKQSLDAFEGVIAALENGLTREQITGMVNAWQSGEASLLLDVARRYNESVPGAAEIEDKFIWSRHDAMAKKLDGFLLDSRERHFVAVGALHLAGPQGLVEMLRRRGYAVKQL